MNVTIQDVHAFQKQKKKNHSAKNYFLGKFAWVISVLAAF